MEGYSASSWGFKDLLTLVVLLWLVALLTDWFHLPLLKIVTHPRHEKWELQFYLQNRIEMRLQEFANYLESNELPLLDPCANKILFQSCSSRLHPRTNQTNKEWENSGCDILFNTFSSEWWYRFTRFFRHLLVTLAITCIIIKGIIPVLKGHK